MQSEYYLAWFINFLNKQYLSLGAHILKAIVILRDDDLQIFIFHREWPIRSCIVSDVAQAQTVLVPRLGPERTVLILVVILVVHAVQNLEKNRFYSVVS